MIFIPFLLINFAWCSNMFEVTQCSNPSTGQPELKFRIQKTFFDLNLKHIYGTDGLSETVEGGENYYIKSVPENLLVVEFDDDSKFSSRNLGCLGSNFGLIWVKLNEYRPKYIFRLILELLLP